MHLKGVMVNPFDTFPEGKMAYKHAINFRLKNATCLGSTYGERLDSLMKQIRATGSTWEETTSFALLNSAETLEQLVDRLYLNSSFSASDDLLIAIDIERGVAVTKGVVKYPTTLGLLLNRLAQK